jgi:hypothetical protein
VKDYTLSKGKIAELEKFHPSLRDKHLADRVKAVVALSNVWLTAQVAEILLFDKKTSEINFLRNRRGADKLLALMAEIHYSRK